MEFMDIIRRRRSIRRFKTDSVSRKIINNNNRIVYMEDGEIVEESYPEEFFTAPKSEEARKFVGSIIDRML